MHTIHCEHMFVLAGPWGLLLLAVLLAIFILGLVDLLGALASGVRVFRRGGGPDEPSAEEATGGEAVGLVAALWAVPGKVRVGGVTIHVGWLVISLAIAALGALLR